MSLSLLIYLGIGGGLGAAWGYFGKCRTGACPLTATPWRGAIYGGVLALMLYFASGQNDAAAGAATANVRLISQEHFDKEVTQSATPVVVDFFATWCGPCKRLSPMIDELAGPLTNQIRFVKVDVDKSQDLARRFEIEGVPTIMFFKDGKVVDKIVGLPSRSELQQRLGSLTGAAPVASVSSSGS